METKQYGLLTAISMVIGIVIGSGIFFKSDDILRSTGGSIVLGLLGFLIVGIGVLFGALVISEYANRSDQDGGIINYGTMAFGKRFGYVVGFAMIGVYFPAFIVVLGYVAATYIGILFGIDSSNFIIIVAFLLIALGLFSNIYSQKVGGIIQETTMFIKLIPLILIGIVGIFFGDTSVDLANTQQMATSSGFLSALILIAFSFDGWLIATSISGEIKDSKKNLPRALIGGVTLTIIIYCLYFVGISKLVGPDQIIALGDAHTEVAAQMILGNIGAKLIIVFVIISVYGGLNGISLAYLRMPQSLIDSGLMKDFNKGEKCETNLNFSIETIKFVIGFLLLYYIIQILVMKGIIFNNLATPFDLSSMPITINYVFYVFLYVGVLRITKERKLSLYIYIIIAVLTSFIVLYGSLQVNGMIYIAISIFVIAVGQLFYNKEQKVS